MTIKGKQTYFIVRNESKEEKKWEEANYILRKGKKYSL